MDPSIILLTYLMIRFLALFLLFWLGSAFDHRLQSRILWWYEKRMPRSRPVVAKVMIKKAPKEKLELLTEWGHEKRAEVSIEGWRGVCLFGGCVCRLRNALIGSSPPLARLNAVFSPLSLDRCLLALFLLFWLGSASDHDRTHPLLPFFNTLLATGAGVGHDYSELKNLRIEKPNLI